MYLNKDIINHFATALKGTPVEVLSARHKHSIKVKCNGQVIFVSIHDLTDKKTA